MDRLRTLVVCEKPDAAARVARAIDEDGIPLKCNLHGVPYFEAGTKNGTVVVCSAIGHLYTLDCKGFSTRRFYPVWDHEWKPRNVVERASARLGRWISAIQSISRNVDVYVNACDYDIEGSLIGFTILEFACKSPRSRTRRMKFSTMTEKEIKSAFRNVASELDFPLVEAGKCRHEVDWLYGINLSRLMTEAALKQGRGYANLSTGRVQGPTLSFVVAREEEIACFVPIPFWAIDATIEYQGQQFPVEYFKEKIATINEAREIVQDCKGKLLRVKDIESHQTEQPPPYPFDLPNLQSEAFRHFGYSPAKTLAVAEKLYLNALISYPRTSSQKLPPDIDYQNILRGLSRIQGFDSLVGELLNSKRLHPVQGFKDDPAHPAIYPTGEKPVTHIIGPEARLLDLVIRRFLATFADPALRESSRIELAYAKHRFLMHASRLVRHGWVKFYSPYASEESTELPDLEQGMEVPVSKVEALEKFTQPPPRFNSASLLRKMEEANIGTKATRAEIIEILYKRGYIAEARMRATPLALKMTQLLKQHCPSMTDPGFTSELEGSMERVQANGTSRRRVLVEALQRLRPVLLDLMGQEESLGVQLADVVSLQRTAETSFDIPCPDCGSALRIVRNPKTKKRFIGCSGKWEKGCNFSLPLPQFGLLSIAREKCKKCGFQLVRVKVRGRPANISCSRCYAANLSRRGLGTGQKEKKLEVEA